jgi:hypothetical protein
MGTRSTQSEPPVSGVNFGVGLPKLRCDYRVDATDLAHGVLAELRQQR